MLCGVGHEESNVVAVVVRMEVAEPEGQVLKGRVIKLLLHILDFRVGFCGVGVDCPLDEEGHPVAAVAVQVLQCQLDVVKFRFWSLL